MLLPLIFGESVLKQVSQDTDQSISGGSLLANF